MRFILSTVLIMVMLLQTFSKTIIVAAFKVRQDYISKNLCENRSNPKLHCNGKCHLHRQLKADDEKQDQNLPSALKQLDEAAFTSNVPENIFHLAQSEILFPVVAERSHAAFQRAVFHPPSAVC